jgi:hypothetical protein
VTLSEIGVAGADAVGLKENAAEDGGGNINRIPRLMNLTNLNKGQPF